MRYNIFNQVHLPLRLALLHASVVLNEEEAIDASFLVKKVQNISLLMNQQLINEEQFILPLVFDYEPCVWDQFIREHHKTKNLLREINHLLNSLQQAFDEEQRWDLATSLKETFHQLILTSYHHMDEEEEVMNEILWRYYSDAILENTIQQMQMLPTLTPSFDGGQFVRTAHAA